MTPKIISESTAEPIGIDEAASNLHAVSADSPPVYFEQARILKLITAARVACEEELEMSLIAKTLEVSANSFASAIDLPNGPVRSIVSVKYLDDDGVDTTLASDQYRFSSYVRAPVLLLGFDLTWPTIRADLDSVRVRYTVGYPSTDSPPQTVPEPIRQAMHLLISHWFVNRDAVDVTLSELPHGVRYILGKFRNGLGV